MDFLKSFFFHYFTKWRKVGGGWCWSQLPTGRYFRNNICIQFYLIRLLPCSLLLPRTSSALWWRWKKCFWVWLGTGRSWGMWFHCIFSMQVSRKEKKERKKRTFCSLGIKRYLIWNSFCLFPNFPFRFYLIFPIVT